MTRITAAVALLAIAAFSAHAVEPIKRSSAARLEFQRHNPCPVTGMRQGKCPGYEIDHVQPLCSGGPDSKANMQWLTVEEHRRKTRVDVRECRLLRPRKN